MRHGRVTKHLTWMVGDVWCWGIHVVPKLDKDDYFLLAVHLGPLGVYIKGRMR